MKRSDALYLICDQGKVSTVQATYILRALESAGFIKPSYLTPDGAGMWDLHHGWEPETTDLQDLKCKG